MPRRALLSLATTLLLAAAPLAAQAQAQAPKHGGILRIYQRDNPASASILEEATYSAVIPFMSIYNNLVIYKQDVPQNSPSDIEPELATSWSWSADNKDLTFKLRSGVKWHDGQAFTSADVKCTFDLMRGTGKDKLRLNPRKTWFENVVDVVTNGAGEVIVKLGRPQPSMLALLASGYAPMYPCHVSAAQMRVHPIGTGPFKFVEYKRNEDIKLTRNTDYWKPGRPYLDGIELPIITNRSTAMLAFIAGKVDMTFPTEVTPQIEKDIKSQAPKSQCFFGPTNVSTNLIVNRTKPPFDNLELRKALALTLDRKAFIDILAQGAGDIGGSLLPAPEGFWGMPPDMMKQMIGYDPDIKKNRDQARAIMAKAGYGPDKRLQIKVATRDLAAYRDAAVVLIDQLKHIYIDATLDPVETSQWFAKIARGDYAVGLNLTGNAVDDPDQSFYENYACKSERNYTHYCNPALEKQFDAQSQELDINKRKQMVWKIDQQLQDDVARPIILHRRAGTCWTPDLHGFVPMVNSSYNGYRFEDLWLNR